jgi:16S rRNA (guanine966-N2)-methyltransferase
VTRIIAGFAGSRELKVPKDGTRPTSDRVREAVFSALDSRDLIEDADVLDLFAGTGALGLEALSRGARSVVCVEHNHGAAAIARHNAEIVVAAGGCDQSMVSISTLTAESFLTSAQSTWDLVFIDPPYELDNSAVANLLTLLPRVLNSNATIVLERSTRSGLCELPAALSHDKDKVYGETTIHWLSLK